MRIEDLNGKTVCMLGFGREGKAMVAALEKFAPRAKITIADKNESMEKHLTYPMQTGSGWLDNLQTFDVIVASPGIPPQELPTDVSIQEKITNSTQIFLDTIADRGAVSIGVTGSKGKSTTASLIAAILKSAGKDVLLLGNIGEPAIAHLEDIQKDTHVVLEMSSYQLMRTCTSPTIAVITSFFPEHLDYHGSMEAYKDAKANVARFQPKGTAVFYNGLFPDAKVIAKMSQGKKVAFTWEDAPLRIEETHLLGMHNLSNMAAASKVGLFLKVPKPVILNALREFKGLPHRLQSLGVHHGIEWVDDAISTTPESTIAALEALGDRVFTIILGGQDRGNDFSELAKKIHASKVEHVILFPGSGPRIRDALEQTENRIKLHEAASMEEAVKIAKDLTAKTKICLLSTASPSYNMFKNFEEKGEVFKKTIGIT